MAKKKNRLAVPLLFAFLLMAPLAVMYVHGLPGGRQGLISDWMASVAAPGQRTVATAIDAVAGVWKSYVFLVNVEQQNQELRQSRKELLDMMSRCGEAIQENTRLQRLLDFRKSRSDFVTVTARVVARDSSPWYRVIRVVLDRGTEDGVRSGMPVITHQGVIGKVERVASGFCDVVLITDVRSKLSAMIQGKEVSGMVIGNGDGMSYSATFQFPFQRVELDPDDLLVTTGHEQIYPKGLAVGRIVTGTVNPSGKQLEVKIVPAADLAHLDEVLIITNYYSVTADPWKEAKGGN